MKDILLYVADADMEAFMRSVFERVTQASYDIKRHPLHDAGMVHSGAELARMEKDKYKKVILMFDYHGSGKEHNFSHTLLKEEMQRKLDSYTLKGKSDVVIIVPELERWLWFSESAILKHYKITQERLNKWAEEMSARNNITSEELKANNPKELFEYIVKEKLHKTISPRDFEKIGTHVNTQQLCKCRYFNLLCESIKAK